MANKNPIFYKVKAFGAKSFDSQKEHKKEGVEIFREFWNSNPTEANFAEAISGWVIFPEISYIMSKTKQEE